MKKKEKGADPKIVIKEVCEKILSSLKIEADITLDKDEEEIWHLRLESPEAGLLIGYHGETLESFQLILGLAAYRKIGSWQQITVHIGDYREKKEASLRELAEQTLEQVLAKREPISLPGLCAGERRIIHLALSGREDVTTESEGEGEARCLIIKPREKTDEKDKKNH